MADMLERLPTITINDLKVGDTILMSSLPGADPTQLQRSSLLVAPKRFWPWLRRGHNRVDTSPRRRRCRLKRKFWRYVWRRRWAVINFL